MLAEALAVVDKTGERVCEAELYRLKGELTLQQSKSRGPRSSYRSPTPRPQRPSRSRSVFSQSHRDCPQAAGEVAGAAGGDEPCAGCGSSRARSTKLTQMLAEIYGWFTEGFDTKDLQEAKALLDSLGSSVQTNQKAKDKN